MLRLKFTHIDMEKVEVQMADAVVVPKKYLIFLIPGFIYIKLNISFFIQKIEHPLKSHPLQSHPLQSHPLQSHPLQSSPWQSHPLQSHPLQSHPLQSQP